jgi:hypothetical protein
VLWVDRKEEAHCVQLQMGKPAAAVVSTATMHLDVNKLMSESAAQLSENGLVDIVSVAVSSTSSDFFYPWACLLDVMTRV